jgi:phospholipid/cholesterol/gamma-HCH transport system substrate-binding protein
VAQKLKPTAGDLRPFVDDVNRTLPELKPIVRNLDPITGNLIPYLPDLTAFVYQVRSISDLGDANGRNSARALLQFGVCSVPVSNPLCAVTPTPPKLPQGGSGSWGDTPAKPASTKSNGG